MASSYPGGYDALSNPTSSDSLAAVPHAAQHANVNDAVEAVQAELGLDPAGASATVKARMDVIEANDWVTSARIAADAVGTSEIADTSVTSAKILDGTVALADLTTGLQSQLQGGTVLTPDALTPAPGELLAKQAVWWIDAQHSASTDAVAANLGWGGTALNAVQPTAGNQPKKLDYAGTPFVYLPGVAGNFLSVPDEAALDIVGDIDIRVKVALDDWTPAARNTLIGKAASNGGYDFYVKIIDGVLGLDFGNGTGYITKVSTVATGITDGTVKWVRVTLDVDNGAAGYDVKFWTSDDGATWTQLGTTVTTATATVIGANATALAVCSSPGGTASLCFGKLYRAIVKNGIDGQTVLDIDTSVLTSGSQATFNALTGQTVTINRSTSGRKSVAVVAPVWLFGTDDYLEVADNDLLDFGATDSFTVVAVVRQWATLVNDGGIIAKGTTGASRWELANHTSGGGVWFDTYNDSSTRVAAQSLALTSGTPYTHVGIVNRTSGLQSIYTNGVDVYPAGQAVTGTFINATVMRVGRTATYADMEFVAAAIFRRVLSAAEIQQITDWMKGRAA